MFLCETENVQIQITKTKHIYLAMNLQYSTCLSCISEHILSCNTFIWNCTEYSQVSWIYLYSCSILQLPSFFTELHAA